MGTAFRWLTTAVIVSSLLGCDNVSWGGIDVSLKGPPPKEGDALPDSIEAPEVVLPELPEGAVLYRAERTEVGAFLSPIAEIVGDSLLPLDDDRTSPGFTDYFVEQRMAPGTEFVLFAEGVRVGRFLTGDSTTLDPAFCAAHPAVGGVMELVPEAGAVTRFLALSSTESGARPWGEFVAPESTRNHRVAAGNVAGSVVMDAGARWPPSMLQARGDLQVFQLEPGGPPLLAGTFLYQDQLRVAPAPAGSYSLFYIAEDEGAGYRWSYYWYRPTDSDGKGAPVFFEHMDWDRDGETEILLQVVGATSLWHAALTRRGDGWARVFEDPCGSPEAQVAPATD